MLYAIFESGGKQFKAVEGSYVEVDHLPTEEGKKVSFDKVLLLVNDKDTQVGTPFIKGASIDTTVANHFKTKKVIIFNYRAKKTLSCENRSSPAVHSVNGEFHYFHRQASESSRRETCSKSRKTC